MENGHVFIPEGISVYGGLEAPNYHKNVANDYAQIKAANLYWHANTIRLQVAETDLFANVPSTQPYNIRFLSALKDQVNYASSLGMVVVINDQTEFTSKTVSPTTMSQQFWAVMADQFRNRPNVIFDIFNEPRLTSAVGTNPLTADVPYNSFVANQLVTTPPQPSKLSSDQAWTLWRNGGWVDGIDYVGMQDLVDEIRDAHAPNIIWAEGTYDARRLPPSQYLLNGTNLVYSIHHPNLNSPQSWRRIGDLAATHPVVEGEWAQYESKWAECYSKAYINAPKYLDFLQRHHIGVIAWSLQENSLLKGTRADGQPTNLNTNEDSPNASDLSTPDKLGTNYNCDTRYGQGVGQLLQDYFAKNSVPYSTSTQLLPESQQKTL